MTKIKNIEGEKLYNGVILQSFLLLPRKGHTHMHKHFVQREFISEAEPENFKHVKD